MTSEPQARDGVSEDPEASLLAPLGDLEGVWGSFVLSGDGRLLLWDMPRVIGEEALDGVAPRLIQLCDALARDGRTIDLCVLRFEEHRLCLRAARDRVIAVVASTAVNVTALKMAMTLTSRRLDRLLLED